jgi:ketosteroid isomerase-like protein
MIRRAVTLLFCCMSIAAAAIALSQQQQPFTPESSPPGRVLVNQPVDVPMQMMNGYPTIEVQVNGQGPFRFGIETGAAFVAITPQLATKLALKRTGGPDDFPSYLLDRVSAGSASFEGVPVYASRFRQAEIDGVLGLPIYSNLLLTLDYENQRMRFAQGELPAPNGLDILAMSHVGPFWGIPIQVAGQSFVAVIDTRSPGTLSVTPAIAEQLKFAGDLAVIGVARGAGLPDTQVRGGQLDGDIVVGRYSFLKPAVHVRALPLDFPQAPVLGSTILQQFTVTLDQKNQRVQLSHTGNPVIQLPPPTRRLAGPEGTPSGTPGTASALTNKTDAVHAEQSQGKNPVRPITSPTLRAEVEALNAAMVSAFRSDPASVAKFYTDDARILGGNQIHQGREEIVSYWAQATMFSDWKLEAIEVGGSADAPWQLGRSTVTSKSGRVMETNFVGILQRQKDGSLKFYLDIYTQSTGTIRF